jgi:gas vesicle protein
MAAVFIGTARQPLVYIQRRHNGRKAAGLNGKDTQMSEGTPDIEPSIPQSTQLMQLREEAAEAATAPDLRERVRELASRALHEQRMTLADVRAIAAAITEGVGDGLSARGGEMKQGLKQAVAGLDDAVSSAAQAASYAIGEAVDQGRAFKDNELKASLEQLRDLESQLVDALKTTAKQSGGKLKEELEHLGDHLKIAGTRTGEQTRESLGQFAAGVKRSGAAGYAGLSDSASAASERLAQAASGVLAALSESLKRQSERMRS